MPSAFIAFATAENVFAHSSHFPFIQLPQDGQDFNSILGAASGIFR